jgi:hypothetical protein
MPRTAEHIVACHQHARARVAAGQPVWEHTINLAGVFHNEDLTFEERRDRIVDVIRASTWYKNRVEGTNVFDVLYELVDELADTTTGDEFNVVWDAVYDEADYDRVWIKTV